MTLDEQKELQNYFIETMKIVAQDALAKASFAKIEEGEVVEVLDEIGQYKVSYLDNVINAETAYPGLSYQIGDKVNLLFTSDNLDDKKFILSNATSIIDNFIKSDQIGYYDVSGNLLDGLSTIVSMCSYETTQKDLSYVIGNNFRTLFDKYCKEYPTAQFSLGMTINTKLPKEQYYANGDFGIYLQLPTIVSGQETFHKFYLNTKNLPGNPYYYNEYVYGETIFTLDEGEFYDAKRPVYLYSYCDDTFIQASGKEDDIFIKDIKLKSVVQYTENNLNTLNLVSSDGPYFSANTSIYEKTLEPILRVNGQKTSIESYPCYWFKENPNVKDIKDERYHSAGGLGWECINNSSLGEDGKVILDTSNKALTVLRSDIISSCRYKCALLINNNAMSDIIKIENLTSEIKVEVTVPEILYLNSGIADCKCTVDYPNMPAGCTLNFQWTRYNNKGNVISIDENSVQSLGLESVYKLPVSFIDRQNTVECSAFIVDTTGETVTTSLVGSDRKQLIIQGSAETSDFNLILENSDKLYKYDAMGNSPMSANYGGAPGSIPAAIQPLGFKIFKKNGEEFTKEDYDFCDITWAIPKNIEDFANPVINSLFVIDEELIQESNNNYVYVKSLTLPYNIRARYDAHAALGQITLTIKYNDAVLTAKPNIIFTKEGENGTNGSKYAAIINYNGFAYNEYDNVSKMNRKMKFVWKCSNNEGAGSWYLHDQINNILTPFDNLSDAQKTLTVNVYNGATLQTGGQVEIEWSIFDSSSTNPCFSIDQNGIISYIREWENADTIFCNTIQAKVKVGNPGETIATEYIYAYYPIEITRMAYSQSSAQSTDYASLVPHIANGFSSVTYSEDGKDPSYDDANSTFTCISKAFEESGLKGFYKYDWTSSANLMTKDRAGQSCTFTPVTNFDNGISQNYVKVKTYAINNLTQAEEEAKREQCQDNIDKYDNYLLDLETIKEPLITDDGRVGTWLSAYYSTLGSNFKSLLEQSNDYLSVRANAIYHLNQIKDIFFNQVVLDFKEKSSEFFIEPYEITDNFGINYLVTNYQNYIDELCRIQLTNLEALPPESRYKINVESILTAEFEENFSTYLTDAGKAYYNTVRKNFSDRATYYNYYASELVKFQNSKFIYGDSYANFIQHMAKASQLIVDSAALNFSTFVLRDADNKMLSDIITTFNTWYDGYQKLYDDYNLVLKRYKSTAEEEQVLKSFSNYDISLFLDRYNYIISTFSKYGILIENQEYIINDSLKQYFDETEEYYTSCKESYELELDGLNLVFDNKNAAIIHIKPIIMLYSRYGNSYINGWDGNKLYIDEENGEYLFAPQVGAGIKENGKFTGILLGGRGSNGAGIDTDIGLFGYSEGRQSIFLNSKNGSATFGLSGAGQIIIDPQEEKALLKSGNYTPKDKEHGIPGSGMEIDLSTPAINFGSGNFSVDKDGNMTTNSGYIGGWEVGVTGTSQDRTPGASVLHSPTVTRELNGQELYTGSANMIYIDSNAVRQDDGTFVPGEQYNPAIYTESHRTLNSTQKGFFIDHDGMSFDNYFKVTNDEMQFGDLTDSGKHWTLKYYTDIIHDSLSRSYFSFGGVDELKVGEISRENAKEFYNRYYAQTHPNESLSETKQIYLGTDGISLGDGQFWVTNDGTLRATRGFIGSWYLTEDRMLGAGEVLQDRTINYHMELNSDKGYLSYAQSGISGTTYGTPEDEVDVYNHDNSYILNNNGLYFGEWKTYLDNVDSYLHSDFGDIAGFHFRDGYLESGKVPSTKISPNYSYLNPYGYNASTGKSEAREKYLGENPQDASVLRENFNPISSSGLYEHYMKISPEEQCITFNATNWNDPRIQGSGCYFGEQGIRLGNTFEVDSFGSLKATQGTIADWKINNYEIWSSNPDSEYPGWYRGTLIRKDGQIFGGTYYSEDPNGIIFDRTVENPGSYWVLNPDGSGEFTGIRIIGGSIILGDVNGTNYFSVDTNGKVICHGIDIRGGKIQIGTEGGNVGFSVNQNGKVNINGGTIQLKDNGVTVFKVDDKGVVIHSTGYIKSNNFKEPNEHGQNGRGFRIEGDGTLYCQKAIIGGVDFEDTGSTRTVVFPAGTTVSAPASDWGGWIINESSISKRSTSITPAGIETGTLKATGATTLTSSLAVTGETTLKTTNINGNLTVNEATNTKSLAVGSGGMTCSQNAVFNNGFNVSGGTVTITPKINTLKAGSLTADSIKVGGQTLQRYIEDIIDSHLQGKYASASHTHSVSGSCTIPNVGNGTISGSTGGPQ